MWHNITDPIMNPFTAAEGYDRMGRYALSKIPLVYADSGEASEVVAIVREPTDDDPQRQQFGTVSPGYSLISPDELCDIWDQNIERQVETMGALGKGERFFITTHLRDYDVKGDEVRHYLMTVNDMTGRAACRIVQSPVRTVCENTLRLAEKMATDTFRLVHDERLAERMADWLVQIFNNAEEKAELTHEAFLLMTGKTFTGRQTTAFFNGVYPQPADPSISGPKEFVERAEAKYAGDMRHMQSRRETCQALFAGAGTGQDTKAAQGTAWGAYNAVVEANDYVFCKPNKMEQSADAALFGYKAQEKSRAFSLALEMSTN